MTLATDWLLAVVVLVLGLRVWRRRAGQRSVAFWAIAFFATSLSAFTGGAWHGLHDRLGEAAAEAVWMTTTVSIGAASFALVVAAVMFGLAGWSRRLLLILALVKFVAYFVWMSSHDDFRFVVIDYVTSMLVVAVIAIANWRASKRASSAILAGLAVSLVGAIVQQSGVGVTRWFNHNDLYHVIQIGAFVLLARGGVNLKDRPWAGVRDERSVSPVERDASEA